MSIVNVTFLAVAKKNMPTKTNYEKKSCFFRFKYERGIYEGKRVKKLENMEMKHVTVEK